MHLVNQQQLVRFSPLLGWTEVHLVSSQVHHLTYRPQYSQN